MSINQTIIDGQVEVPPYIGNWGRLPGQILMVVRHFPIGTQAPHKSQLQLVVADPDNKTAQSLLNFCLKKGDYIVVGGKNRGVTEIVVHDKPTTLTTIKLAEWNTK
jgi:hypothetical protein